MYHIMWKNTIPEYTWLQTSDFNRKNAVDIRAKFLDRTRRGRRFYYDMTGGFSKDLIDIYQKLKADEDFIIFNSWDTMYPHLEYDIHALFKRVTNPVDEIVDGKYTRETCYWIAVEPFKFFLDIDSYHEPTIPIEKVLEVVGQYCTYFLTCQALPANITGIPLKEKPDRESFIIYTDTVLTYVQAKALEFIIATQISKNETVQRTNYWANNIYHFPEGIIGSIYHYYAPLTTRRAPFSLQYLWNDPTNIKIGVRARPQMPRLDLSRLPKQMTDFECFEFSYPNFLNR